MRARSPTRYDNTYYRESQQSSRTNTLHKDEPKTGISTDDTNQAIGIIPGKEGGVTLLVKKSDKHHQPAFSTQTTTFGPSRSTRKYVFHRSLQYHAKVENALTSTGPTPVLSAPPPSATTAQISARTPLPAPPPSARARGPSRPTSPPRSGAPRPRRLR